MLEHRSINGMRFVGSNLLVHRKRRAEQRCGLISHFVRRFSQRVPTNLKGSIFSSAEKDFLRELTCLVALRPSSDSGTQAHRGRMRHAYRRLLQGDGYGKRFVDSSRI
jgi:hypothetical protein